MVKKLAKGETIMKNKKIPCEVYSRIVGYFRPLDQWNAAKREEFKDRHTFVSPTKTEVEKVS